MVTFANRARMSTGTTGTGAITLGSALPGYVTFAEAGVADGDDIAYCIEDGTSFEVGHGIYTAAGTHLTRNVLISKIVGEAADTTPISLSGNATVFVTAAAEDLAAFLTAVDAAATYQPLDSDLTAIAALSTTSYGRGLLTLASAAALAAEVDSFFLTPAEADALFLTPTEGNAAYQPLDADLTELAALRAVAVIHAFNFQNYR